MKINVYTAWINILHAFQVGVLWMLLEYIFEDYAFEFTWIDLIGRWTIAIIWVRFIVPFGSNDARKETLLFVMAALVYMMVAPLVAYTLGCFPDDLTPRMFLLYPLQVNAMNAVIYLASVLFSDSVFEVKDKKEMEGCR